MEAKFLTGVRGDHIFHRDLSRTYPLIERGEGVYLYGVDGRRYLDACGGALVVNVGHGSREVVGAMAEQATKVGFAHTNRFETEALWEAADRVAALAPGDLERVYFVGSGSEAVESAVKLARQYHRDRGNAGKYKVIGRWQSYHGNTLGALSVGGDVKRRRPYAPMAVDFPHIPAPYCYRCRFGREYPGCGLECAQALEREILAEGPENVAAFIAEPVIGNSVAAFMPPKEYYPAVREICDRYDALFVADEVMAGFGRTGRNFSIDHWGVAPDIITFGKGVSSGYAPLAGIIASKKIVDVLLEKSGGRFVHGHTYAGHPVSAAAGAAVLRIIERDGLVERSRAEGEVLLEKIRGLAGHPSIGEIRGIGLMVGIELVRDRTTKEPFDLRLAISERLTRLALEEGVLLYPGSGCADGASGDSILIGPPYTITRSEMDEIVRALDKCLTQIEKENL